MDKNAWHHFGTWVNPVLSTSLWLEINFKELDFDFVKTTKHLDGHYFFLKKELKQVQGFIEDKIEPNPQWFNKLFCSCDEKIKSLFSFKKGKDINGFFKAAAQCLNCSMIIELSDYGLENYIKKYSEKTGISPEGILFFIQPYKKTPLMKFQEELRSVKKVDIPKFIKKYEWIGTHMFTGTGLNEQRVKEELIHLRTKKKLSKRKFPPHLLKLSYQRNIKRLFVSALN